MKKVVANAMGFYKGARVRAGETFVVPDDFSGSWFYGDEPQPKARKGRPRKSEVAQEVEQAPDVD